MTKVHIRFPEPLADAIDRAAERRMTTRSEIIRQAVVDQLRRDGLVPAHAVDGAPAAGGPA
jgi:metal-responsive CopG/Arc/MetJ family transcriptional regulator